jgi:general stress protein YciG
MAERNESDTASTGDGRGRETRESGARPSNAGSSRPPGAKSNRGFASMDRERQREIASKGGRAAHEKGTAHEWTPDEAREAGRKGGEMVSRDRAHMAAIGREGGGARSNRNRQSGSQPAVRQEEGESAPQQP